MSAKPAQMTTAGTHKFYNTIILQVHDIAKHSVRLIIEGLHPTQATLLTDRAGGGGGGRGSRPPWIPKSWAL